jgi:ABC-type multidrug transport system ATPase subunit/ABC-type multidrug transport system permease subunit
MYSHDKIYMKMPKLLLCLYIVLFISILIISEAAKDDIESDGLFWKELTVSTRKQNKILLHKSTGFVPNGKVAAIIGPSGAGKSTLLRALSGSIPKGSKRVSGNVWLTSQAKGSMSLSARDVALLRQHDTFFSMLTARETMNLATFFQLDLNKAEQEKLVDNTLDKLGLRHVEHMRIGDEGLHHGCLSGGERRRLSIALELVSNPKVFIADEPTTGLDSAQAQKSFLAIVRASRERNIPFICSLHQPRASIWKELDYFILMAPGGRIVYQGDREHSVVYFAKLGYECPKETTPAEYFIDLVTVDSEDEQQAKIDNERIDYLVSSFHNHQKRTMNKLNQHNLKLWSTLAVRDRSRDRYHRRFPVRICVLMVRSLRQNLRDVRVNLLRSFASIGLARLFSELFSGMKKGTSNAKSVADRTALLSYGVINMTMMSMMKTINLFAREKEVVLRERMRKNYSSLDYLLSKSLAELPLDMFFSGVFAFALKQFTGLVTPLVQLVKTFSVLTLSAASLGFAIGSVSSNAEEAFSLGLPIMTVLMAVGVINPSGVDETMKKPLVIQLLKRLSPISAAIEAVCITEYKGMSFDQEGNIRRWNIRDLPRMGGLALVRNGDDVLKALGLSGKSYNQCIEQLGFISFISLIGSWIGLHITGPKSSEHGTQNGDDEDNIMVVDASSIIRNSENRLNPSLIRI